MAIARIDYVEQPFAGKRPVADRSRLAALYARMGADVADGRLRGVDIQQRGYQQLADIFGSYFKERRQDRAIQADADRRSGERDEERAYQAQEAKLERESRALDQKLAREERERIQNEANAYKRGAEVAATVEQGPLAESQVDPIMAGPDAGRVRYSFGPGTADGPELMPTPQQAKQAELEKQVAGMGGIVGPNGQIVMPPRPQTTKALKLEPAMVDGKRTFVVFDPETGQAKDFAGRPVNAQPIPPQGPAGGEPLEAVIGADGNPVLMPRSQALGRRPATTREQPTEDERKAAGFYKQMKEAMATLDEVEPQLTEKDLYQIQTLPQEALIGALNRGEMSEAAKRYLRAFEQFTEARMRPVSGAAISDSEFARDRRTYARQYSETPALAKDRKAARQSALDSLQSRASRALPKDAEKPKDVDPLGIRK